MVVKAKTMIQRSGSKREGDDLYIWPCRGLRVSASFFTILGLLPGLLLAKKRRFLSLVSHGRDSIRLSRYVSQSDYVVLLAAAACGAAAAFVGNVRMWYVMKYVRRKLSLSFPNGLSARARRMTIERAPRHISGPPEHRGTVGICPNHLLAANLTLF